MCFCTLLSVWHLWASLAYDLYFSVQPDEIEVIIGKDREGFFTSGLTLGKKKCSVIRDSLQIDGDWTMDIRTKSQGGEPTYNVSVGRAGKGKICCKVNSQWGNYGTVLQCISRCIYKRVICLHDTFTALLELISCKVVAWSWGWELRTGNREPGIK